jgi:phosphoribosyl-AMP cyclohydrolase
MNLFRRAETLTLGESLPWDAVLAALPFNADGLLPAIAQQADSGEVLMLAWMNREAILETLSSGRVCYWSRSRQTLWRKGETSGHQQSLKELRIDCDGDTLLLLVDQQGPTCHTRRVNCFYHAVRGERVVVISEPQPIDESRFNQP